MKKLKIGVKGVKDTLSREELKQILGGVSGSGSNSGGSGGCIRCTTDSGMSSCYFTTGSPEALCERVYPNQHGMWEAWYDCNGCIMN